MKNFLCLDLMVETLELLGFEKGIARQCFLAFDFNYSLYDHVNDITGLRAGFSLHSSMLQNSNPL